MPLLMFWATIADLRWPGDSQRESGRLTRFESICANRLIEKRVASLQKLVGEFFLIFGREIGGGKIWREFFGPTK